MTFGRLIGDFALGEYAPTGRDVERDLETIREHIAAAGFDPACRLLADRRVVGLARRAGPAIEVADRLPAAELHYLRHVVS